MKLIVFPFFLCVTVSLCSNQTEEIVVDEPRGKNYFVPFTLIREKGTYGTVTVNFEVRGQSIFHKTSKPKKLCFILFNKDTLSCSSLWW